MDLAEEAVVLGYELIKDGTIVEFETIETEIEDTADGEEKLVRVELQLGGDEPGEDAEWGALGFIYVLAILSFADARPRGMSEADFEEGDQLSVRDLVRGLRYVRGNLEFSADYVKGRCVKTDVTVRPDGRVTLRTRCRGEAAVRWVDRLEGKKTLQVVETID